MPKWLARLLSYVPFNQGNPKVQLGVIVVLLLLIAGFATRCHAGEGAVEFGVGSTVVRGAAPVIDLAVVYPKAGPGDADYEIGATFIGHSDFRGAAQPSNFALRAAIVEGFGRFDVGFGIVYLQNTDAYNGSNLNFTLSLSYRIGRFRARQLHISNGGTRSPNKGRDMTIAAWRLTP